MTTAEYAVGTVAAVAFAALLLAIVRSGPVKSALTEIIVSRARHGVVTRGAHPGAGAATAELAVALPSLVLVLALALGALGPRHRPGALCRRCPHRCPAARPRRTPGVGASGGAAGGTARRARRGRRRRIG